MPDDGQLWLGLARETLAVQPAANTSEASTLPANATSAALQRLQAARAPPRRAPKCWRCSAPASTSATSTGRRCRPMRRALRWSLRRRSRPTMHDLKARKGFRVIDHTRRCRHQRAAHLRAVLRGPGQDRRRLCAVRHRRRRARRRASRPRTSRSASKGSSTASITTSPSAPACRPPSAK